MHNCISDKNYDINIYDKCIYIYNNDIIMSILLGLLYLQIVLFSNKLNLKIKSGPNNLVQFRNTIDLLDCSLH